MKKKRVVKKIQMTQGVEEGRIICGKGKKWQ